MLFRSNELNDLQRNLTQRKSRLEILEQLLQRGEGLSSGTQSVLSGLDNQAIAAETGVSPATVSRVLKRLGLNRLSALEPAEPPRRYQRDRPGELIHIDIKKLGKFNRVGHRITGDRTGQSNNRGIGWEFVHVAIDDASRIAFSRIRKTERQACAVAFLKAAVAYYASLGITVERVMTDNGSCYRSRRFRNACRRLGLKHIFTRPYTPRTNVTVRA